MLNTYLSNQDFKKNYRIFTQEFSILFMLKFQAPDKWWTKIGFFSLSEIYLELKETYDIKENFTLKILMKELVK